MLIFLDIIVGIRLKLMLVFLMLVMLVLVVIVFRYVDWYGMLVVLMCLLVRFLVECMWLVGSVISDVSGFCMSVVMVTRLLAFVLCASISFGL